jgi:hypothetical protein
VAAGAAGAGHHGWQRQQQRGSVTVTVATVVAAAQGQVVMVSGGRDVICGGWSSLPTKLGGSKKIQQTDLGNWGQRFVTKNKKQICESKKTENEQISRQTTNKFDFRGHSIISIHISF